MNKKQAIGYLEKKLSEIPTLAKLRYDNSEYPIWLGEIRGVVAQVFGKESYEYEKLAPTYKISSVYGEQNSYKRNLRKRAIALSSIIQTWEALGFETENEASEPPKVPVGSENWEAIKREYNTTKRSFGRKINFVTDPFKREIIFRDIEQAFVLASSGFSKPAVILAGGVIEELLRQYLKQKNIKPIKDDFDGYIQTCEEEGLLKKGIYHLTDSARHFRNIVHLSKEETPRHTISKSTAIGAVSSIFTIANDF